MVDGSMGCRRAEVSRGSVKSSQSRSFERRQNRYAARAFLQGLGAWLTLTAGGSARAAAGHRRLHAGRVRAIRRAYRSKLHG